jgi:hypothetical protein
MFGGIAHIAFAARMVGAGYSSDASPHLSARGEEPEARVLAIGHAA